MSVHGEFERYVRTLAQVLRTTGDPGRIGEADEIERLALAPDTALSARAEALLDGVLADDRARATWPPEAAEALDPLIHIAHIILGR
jgi:hypothetical protein